MNSASGLAAVAPALAFQPMGFFPRAFNERDSAGAGDVGVAKCVDVEGNEDGSGRVG